MASAPSTTTLSREELLRRMPWAGPNAPDWAPLVEREWLVTNGLGGYASGTVSGAATRRYHGLLIAAEPPPLGRVLTLTDLVETIRLEDGWEIQLGGEERSEKLELHGARYLTEFRLEWGLPVWVYSLGDSVFEKRLTMVWDTNTTAIEYRLLEGSKLRLTLHPVVRFRRHETPVDAPLENGYSVVEERQGVRVTGIDGFPDLRLRLEGGAGLFEASPRVLPAFMYRVEASRGYAAVGDTWSPGSWSVYLDSEDRVRMVASTEEWEEIPEDDGDLFDRETERRRELTRAAHPLARTGVGAELVLAADQFVIRPIRKHRTEGARERSVIAGYHWFTDWGRDTMIALEGLTLLTGRHSEAGAILRTFGSHVRDGLIPNLFPEGGNEGLYHTADASLWFFHAIHRYLTVTDDRETLEVLFPKLREIVAAHLAGTQFGIGVDPEDGLLRQGAPGYQLTWMDAKVGDWVVTPRRGKAVEINALWYNALRLMEGWERDQEESRRAQELARHAERAREAFNSRFWIESTGSLLDLVDGEKGDDDAFRPNQIFSVSLPHAVLDESRWESVVEAVREKLLTPVGLRSLSADHPDYRRTYLGNLGERDAAYHQGTVWGWLIGPFLDAWLKVHPGSEAAARRFLAGFFDHLDDFGVGSVAEIFDAEAPHRPRGCIAQAWSVAELLRCLVRLESGADQPLHGSSSGTKREGGK
jgi:predicted glycogen debranching enzyme